MSLTVKETSLFSVTFLIWIILQAKATFLSPYPSRRRLHDASQKRRKGEGGPGWTSMTVYAEPDVKQGNQKVRKMMDLIVSECMPTSDGNTSPAEWKKTRNYLYRANKSLSPAQVSEVVSFLSGLFPVNVVCTVLQSSPRILRKNVNGSLKPTADFLQKLYPPELFQEAISRNPALLLTSGVVGGENKDMELFLRDELGLSQSTVTKLKKTMLFQLQVSKVRSTATFLDGILQSGGSSDTESHRILGKILLSHAYIASLSVKTNLQPRIAFLMERCDLQKRDVATLVKKSPGILGLSVELNLKPKLDYLSSIIADPFQASFDEGERKLMLRKCLLGHPQLLALSLKNLETKVEYFKSIDQLVASFDAGSSLARKIAVKSPAVFSLSLRENIIPKVDLLAKVWGCQSPQVRWADGEMVLVESQPEVSDKVSLAKRLREYPNILTLSLEGNIQPTISFFNRTGYIALGDDWKESSDVDAESHSLPGRYIGASLFSRLLPRWHHVSSKEWQAPSDAASKLPPLHVLVAATDKDFCRSMGFNLDEFVQFKTENAPRLKFSSQFDTWLKCGRPIDVR